MDADRGALLRRRRSMTDKPEKDRRIQEAFLESELYRDCGKIFIYISTAVEVCTDMIVERAFSDGREVCVPFCEKPGKMSFFAVRSIDELRIGRFGVPEPVPLAENERFPDEDTVVAVPGLSFDENGFRIGFGGGFYDRYLQRNDVKTIGLCYDEFVEHRLSPSPHDVPVDIIITDKRNIIIKE